MEPMGPKVVPMGPQLEPMVPEVMPMGPKGPILGNPWKVTLQGRGDVDFLIDVCSEMVGQELISRIPRIPRIPVMWWQQACPRPYLPPAPGVRMT